MNAAETYIHNKEMVKLDSLSKTAKIKALRKFAKWCISDKFDSRDIGIRAQTVLEETK